METQLSVKSTHSITGVEKFKAAPKSGSKLAKLLKLLSRKNGGSIEQLKIMLGWQSHTIRAAICRLRKNGLKIETGKTKTGQTTYRLVPDDSGTEVGI